MVSDVDGEKIVDVADTCVADLAENRNTRSNKVHWIRDTVPPVATLSSTALYDLSQDVCEENAAISAQDIRAWHTTRSKRMQEMIRVPPVMERSKATRRLVQVISEMPCTYRETHGLKSLKMRGLAIIRRGRLRRFCGVHSAA